MAHKKGAGSSKNGRESHSKRLGVKLFGGQEAIPGNIIIRQRGTKYHPGSGVGIGKDHTIFATVEGNVFFRRKKDNRLYVSVIPTEGVEDLPRAPKKKAAPKPEKAETKKAEVKEEKKVKAEAVVEAPKKEKKVEAPKETKTEAPKEKKAEAPKEKKAEAPKPAPKEKETSGELTEEEAAAKMKDLLANVGEVKAADKNDLKKIKGVGPVFEKKLNSIGLYTFAQLSKLDDKGIEALEALINQSGRVSGEDWIGQANELMKK